MGEPPVGIAAARDVAGDIVDILGGKAEPLERTLARAGQFDSGAGDECAKRILHVEGPPGSGLGGGGACACSVGVISARAHIQAGTRQGKRCPSKWDCSVETLIFPEHGGC